jgi:quercetin dioxygenase-like cupin family protein
MPRLFAVTISLATISLFSAFAQEPPLAPEGRGLLPRVAEVPAGLESKPPPHVFQPDPSGGFSRIVFGTDGHPDFKLVIREFSFPPGGQVHTITLPESAVVHLLGGPGTISIAKQRLSLSPVERVAVPSGAPLEITNSGEQHVVVRALMLEVK